MDTGVGEQVSSGLFPGVKDPRTIGKYLNGMIVKKKIIPRYLLWPKMNFSWDTSGTGAGSFNYQEFSFSKINAKFIKLLWKGTSEYCKYKFKGNPNSQGILNWILQILLYQCSKQHKNIENLLFIEQNIVISFCLSLCLLRLVLPLPFSTADVFQFLDTVLCKILNITSDHLCCCIKNWAYNNFNLCYSIYLQLKKVYTNLSQAKT